MSDSFSQIKYNSEHMGKFAEIELATKKYGSVLFNMHYYEEGEGPPVIFIHGIGQSLYTWRNNISPLSMSGYRAVALDLPGFGYSDKPEIDYSIADMSYSIEAFLCSLNIEKADFVAFSTGALYLLDFVCRNPQRVRKITLVSPGIPNDGYPKIAKRINSFMYRRNFFSINEKFISRILYYCFFDKTCITKDVIDEYYKPFKNKYTGLALLSSMDNYDYKKVLSRLEDIFKLCLIFWSKDDVFNDAEIIQLFHAPIQTAHLYTVRNCGHLLHEEKYNKFNEVFIDFLNWRRKKIIK